MMSSSTLSAPARQPSAFGFKPVDKKILYKKRTDHNDTKASFVSASEVEQMRPNVPLKRDNYLTMTRSYIRRSGWSLEAGVREMVQNHRDGCVAAAEACVKRGQAVSLELQWERVDWVTTKGQRESVWFAMCARRSGGTMLVGTVRWNVDSRELELTNFATILKPRVLLLGESSKDGPQYVGAFGEGLKMGVGVLLEKGTSVMLETHNERWRFSFANDPRYPTATSASLKVQATRCKTLGDVTRVLVGGLDSAKFKIENYLHLVPPSPSTVISLPRGELLLDARFKGQLFCKGFFVHREPDMGHGVNLRSIRLSRDRTVKVEDIHALPETLAGLWDHAVMDGRVGGVASSLYFSHLSLYPESLECKAVSKLSDGAVQLLATMWSSQKPNAIPVLETNQAKIDYVNQVLKLEAVPCNQSLHSVLIRSGLVETPDKATQRMFSSLRSAPSMVLDGDKGQCVERVRSRAEEAYGVKSSDLLFKQAPDGCPIKLKRVNDEFIVNGNLLKKDTVHQLYLDMGVCCQDLHPSHNQQYCLCREVFILSLLAEERQGLQKGAQALRFISLWLHASDHNHSDARKGEDEKHDDEEEEDMDEEIISPDPVSPELRPQRPPSLGSLQLQKDGKDASSQPASLAGKKRTRADEDTEMEEVEGGEAGETTAKRSRVNEQDIEVVDLELDNERKEGEGQTEEETEEEEVTPAPSSQRTTTKTTAKRYYDDDTEEIVNEAIKSILLVKEARLDELELELTMARKQHQTQLEAYQEQLSRKRKDHASTEVLFEASRIKAEKLIARLTEAGKENEESQAEVSRVKHLMQQQSQKLSDTEQRLVQTQQRLDNVRKEIGTFKGQMFGLLQGGLFS